MKNIPDSWTATVNFSYFVKCIFFTDPAKTLSDAISKSIASTWELSFLDAKIAASLHKFAISAPENPGLRLANRLAYSSIDIFLSRARGFRWILNISFLPSKSGGFTSI